MASLHGPVPASAVGLREVTMSLTPECEGGPSRLGSRARGPLTLTLRRPYGEASRG